MTEYLFAGGAGTKIKGFLEREPDFLDDRIEKTQGYLRRCIWRGGFRHYVIGHAKEGKEIDIQGIILQVEPEELDNLDKIICGYSHEGKRTFEREEIITHSGLTAWAYIYQK